LDEAYKVLGVKKGSSLDEISKAYKEKMIKSHPDKVSHLSIELQEKAKELTLRFNDAIDLIKKSRK
jgi:DnaJ like chaperone protein